ncbi:hypothetical protein D9M69_438880 [compost metagenome]
MESIISWLKETLVSVLDWLLELLLWLPKKLWSMLLDGLAGVIEDLPVPSFVAQADSFFGNIPGSVVYFFQFFAVGEGLAMVSLALILRFALRRIPLIG